MLAFSLGLSLQINLWICGFYQFVNATYTTFILSALTLWYKEAADCLKIFGSDLAENICLMNIIEPLIFPNHNNTVSFSQYTPQAYISKPISQLII